MFTGIIETLAVVKKVVKEQENVHLTIKSNITNELKVDQSVAHNGVCLTVVAIDNDTTLLSSSEGMALNRWNNGYKKYKDTAHNNIFTYCPISVIYILIITNKL